MSIPYVNFFRDHGVRRIGELPQPKFSNISELQLPRDSIYIYQATGVEDGPGLDDIYLKSVTRPIMMEHVTDLTSKRGNIRPTPFNSQTVIKKYHSKNRKYRFSNDITSGPNDPTVPGVINMALIQRPYKYNRNIFTEYHRWYNGFHTTLSKMASLAEKTSKNIFIEISLPRAIPSISLLRMIETSQEDIMDNNEKEALGFIDMQTFDLGTNGSLRKELNIGNEHRFISMEAINSGLVQKMAEPGSFFISEFWKWLGVRRDNSLLTLLTGNYNKINLIFRIGQSWTLVNLGVVDNWRKTPDGEKILIPTWNKDKEDRPVTFVTPNRNGVSTKQIQLFSMKFFMRVCELNTSVSDLTPYEDEKTETVSETNAEEVVTGQSEEETATTSSASSPDEENKEEPQDTLYDSAEDASKYAIDEATLEDQLTKLAELTSTVNSIEVDKAVMAKINEAHTPESGLLAICDKLAENSAISANEYKNYRDIAGAYKKIKVVGIDGKETTLGDLTDIKPEHLAINRGEVFKDKLTIFDKSMLRSTFATLDKNYIKNVYQRDVASMVVNLQKAGVVITGYETEISEDASGSYQVLAIRIKPVIGTQSTLRMKIPHLDEDGTWKSNDVKYGLRRQRGD